MKCFFCALCIALGLSMPALALTIPSEIEQQLPSGTEDIIELEALSPDAGGLADGLLQAIHYLCEEGSKIIRHESRAAVQLLLAIFLCGVVASAAQEGRQLDYFLPMAGSLAIMLLSVGSLDSLLGLGRNTIHQLADFSKVLLPAMAAATAIAGGVSTAAVQQMATTFFVEIAIQATDSVLLPLLLLYIGLLTASSCFAEERLQILADGLKKAITWALTAMTVLFTGYLTAARVFSGTADSVGIKLTKATLSGAIPVVGGILADAAEVITAGSCLARNSLGLVGLLALISACLLPFLRLGIQYLLYKLISVLVSVMGAPSLCKLLSGLGSAFGLILGMTGCCAFLLLISILSSVAVVT